MLVLGTALSSYSHLFTTAWEQLLKLENTVREQRRHGMTFSLLDFLPVLTFLFALKNAFDPSRFRIALKF